MKKTKEKITIISFILLFISIFTIIIVLSRKYEEVSILSLRQEYNYVFTSNDDILPIHIYFEKKNTFLSNIDEIDSTSISNDSYKFMSLLESVDQIGTINYKNKKYYGFSFNLTFPSYDGYTDPVFISNGIFNVNFKNGEKMSYEIGNLSLYFNSQVDEALRDISITKLEAVVNDVLGVETIVGINLRIKNVSDQKITINSIKIENKYYELDYLNYENKLLDSKANLVQRNSNYSYIAQSIINGEMGLELSKDDVKELFIPIKYINGIKYLDRFPLYIKYIKSSEEYRMVQDDFRFINKNIFESQNGIVEYVYRYY